MRHVAMAVVAVAVLAAGTCFAQADVKGFEAGVGFGASWPMSGNSPIQIGDFTDDFNTGISINAYAAGPISGMFGWRGEFGWDRLPTDDTEVPVYSGDYKLARFQGGVQVANFKSEGKSRPYAFFTVGLVHQSFSLDTDTGGLTFNGTNDFGLSFGGGYNYRIGGNWGIGGDVHINSGFFQDDTRWWWTPSGQVFFTW